MRYSGATRGQKSFSGKEDGGLLLILRTTASPMIPRLQVNRTFRFAADRCEIGGLGIFMVKK